MKAKINIENDTTVFTAIISKRSITSILFDSSLRNKFKAKLVSKNSNFLIDWVSKENSAYAIYTDDKFWRWICLCMLRSQYSH